MIVGLELILSFGLSASIVECDGSLKKALEALRVEETRVRPALDATINARLARNPKDPYFVPYLFDASQRAEEELWNTTQFDSHFAKWRLAQHDAKLPEYTSIGAKIPRGPVDQDALGVQEVTMIGEGETVPKKYAVRPLALEHILGDFIPLKSRAAMMAYRFAEYLLADKNPLPKTFMARVDGEVSVVSEWIEGIEGPSDPADELKKKFPSQFVRMQILNFVYTNHDIIFLNNDLGAKLKVGWKGVFLTPELGPVVFDYNLAPMYRPVAHSSDRLFGTTLPDEYPKEIVDRLVELSDAKLQEMEFYPHEILGILFMRDVILADFELRKRPLMAEVQRP